MGPKLLSRALQRMAFYCLGVGAIRDPEECVCLYSRKNNVMLLEQVGKAAMVDALMLLANEGVVERVQAERIHISFPTQLPW